MPSKAQHIDYDMLEELKEIMEDEFLELLRAFLSDSEMRIKSLKVAYSANDHENARKIAHSFKGSSGNIGAHNLSQMCKQFEELAKNGRTSDAGSLLAGLETEFDSVSSELQNVVSAQL